MNKRAIIISVIQIFISATLIYWVAGKIDVNGLETRLGNANPWLVGVALLLAGAQVLLATARWHLVNRALAFANSYVWHLKTFFSGLFFSQVLPTTFGGDAYRLWAVARSGYGYSKGTLSVVCDRAIGLAALLALIGLSLPVLHGLIGAHQAFWGLAAVVAVGLLGFAAALFAAPYFIKYAPLRLVEIIMAPAMGLRRILLNRRESIVQLFLGLFIHVLSVGIVIVLSRGFAVELPMLVAFALIPAVIFLSSLPISVAGWGVREGVMVAGFSIIGLNITEALLLSVSFGLVNLGMGLAGALVWATDRSVGHLLPNKIVRGQN